MWVRSQNRELLIDVKHFLISEEEDKYAITLPDNEDGGWVLGMYSDGDQAYGIMDEIQMRLNEGCPQVYRMPVDEFEANTIDTTTMIENKDFYNVLENARTKREEVEQAIENFKLGLGVKDLKIDTETVKYVLRVLRDNGHDIRHTGSKSIDDIINEINEEE